MSITGAIILSLYGVLGIVFFAVLFYVKRKGRELFGRPSMGVYTQMIGKFALILPSLILPVAAYGKNLSLIDTPSWMPWIAAFVCFVSMIFLNLSLLQMGRYTKMGLPDKDEVKLQTEGIYSISRNPMYLGLILLAIASNLYVPNPVNALAAIVGVFIHHQIIMSEEHYLENTFGDLWLDYKLKVRRYI